MKTLLLLSLLAVAYGVEFQMLQGKMADPCNKHLNPHDDFRKDCEKHSQLPAPSVTILIPSVTSGTSTTVPTGTSLYNQRLTITGIGFPRTATTTLTLADSRDSCRFVESTAKVTKVAATTNSFGTEMYFQVVSGWDSLELELEDRPRLLCWSPRDETVSTTPETWRYTGFKIGVVWNCDDKTDADQTARCGSDTVRKLSADWKDFSPLQRETRIQRSACCKGKIANTLGVGQCVNPNVQGCCGGSAFEVGSEKCCNSTGEWIGQVDGFCPCSEARDCPTGESCCVPNKYTELPPFNKSGFFPMYRGNCYEPTRHSCCDTGSIYDPGSQQCCKINGIQSVNTPCPCGTDSHCQATGVVQQQNHTCCRQTAPTPFESTSECNTYANFPTGQGSHYVQRCLGHCIDPNYQICCNGAACMKTYERCCNSTCCNRWTSSCFNALRPGSPMSKYNSINFGTVDTPTIYEVCSSMEAITTIKAFWVFVLPSILLLAAHLALALVMVFATKATPRSFSKLEYSLMALAVIISYLAMPLFFSPVWKFGVWVIISQLVVFLTAAARIRWLNVLCVLVQLITLVFLFDPFHGNALLTLTHTRKLVGMVGTDDVMQSGILHAVAQSWHTIDLTSSQDYCSRFYDYFKLDTMLRDTERFDNGMVSTFGYCSRGWVLALLVLASFVAVGVFLQAFLSLLGLFFRFHHESDMDEDEDDVDFIVNEM